MGLHLCLVSHGTTSLDEQDVPLTSGRGLQGPRPLSRLHLTCWTARPKCPQGCSSQEPACHLPLLWPFAPTLSPIPQCPGSQSVPRKSHPPKAQSMTLSRSRVFADVIDLKSVCMLSCSVVSDSAIPWTVAHQAPLPMGFSRQEYWGGLP